MVEISHLPIAVVDINICRGSDTFAHFRFQSDKTPDIETPED